MTDNKICWYCTRGSGTWCYRCPYNGRYMSIKMKKADKDKKGKNNGNNKKIY